MHDMVLGGHTAMQTGDIAIRILYRLWTPWCRCGWWYGCGLGCIGKSLKLVPNPKSWGLHSNPARPLAAKSGAANYCACHAHAGSRMCILHLRMPPSECRVF